MRRRIFRNPMVGLTRRREKLFDSTLSDKPKPTSSFKLPSSDLFLTLVIVFSYFLTRMTYEQNNGVLSKSKELMERVGLNEVLTNQSKTVIDKSNEVLNRKPTKPSDNRLFKMNNHYKRANKKISDVIFLSLLAFFVFKVNWNNMSSSTNTDKIGWTVSVLVAPIIINIFIENKNKLKIEPDSVSSVEELNKTNNQTKAFLSIALLFTFCVGAKLVHRIMLCKGGMTKPLLVQIIIIGTAVGLYFVANEDLKKHNSITEDTIISETGRGGEDNKNNILKKKSVNQHGWVIAFLLILSFTVCKKDTIDYIIEGSLWGYLIQNIARWDDISPDLM